MLRWPWMGMAALVLCVVAAALIGSEIASVGEPHWGTDWTAGARSAAEQTRAAMQGDRTALVLILCIGASLALASVTLLLMGEREKIRPSVTARWAIGASPRRLRRFLLGRHASALRQTLGVGAVLAVVFGCAAAVTSPGLVIGAGSLLWAVVALGLGSLLVVFALAAGALSPLVGLERRGPDTLRRGAGVTDDPRAGTVRRILAVLQISMGFAMVVSSLALVPGPGGEVPVADADIDADAGTLQVVAVTDPPALLERARASDALALGSPGSFIGRGMSDRTLIWCGRCPRVGSIAMPVPMHLVDTMVHVVSTGFLEGAGLELVRGRWLRSGDLGGDPVVVINEEMASYFHRGRALGHQIRIDREADQWARVVGIVRNRETGIPGGESATKPVLYRPLSHPALRSGELASLDLLRSSPGEAEVEEAMTTRGPGVELSELRRRAAAPGRWGSRMMVVSGLMLLLIALVSAREVARVEAEGRMKAAAVRVAVGAPPLHPAILLVRRVAGTTLVALGIGFLVARALTDSVGAFTMPTESQTALLGLALLLAVLSGICRPLRRLASVDPAQILRGG